MAEMLAGMRAQITTASLLQGDRQHKGTDVCFSHGHGNVSMLMQLVSKHRSPSATCKPQERKAVQRGVGCRLLNHGFQAGYVGPGCLATVDYFHVGVSHPRPLLVSMGRQTSAERLGIDAGVGHGVGHQRVSCSMGGADGALATDSIMARNGRNNW